MIWKFMRCLAIVALVAVLGNRPAAAYIIDISQGGLVDPTKTVTGLNYTSPFDAQYDPVAKTTDVWLSDMNGSYGGRRVFNWTLDESGGGQVWTYNGAFTTADTSGIRAINIKDAGSIMVAHGNGTIATYARNTGVAGYTDLGTVQGTFNIGATPHHMAFDGTHIWTNTGYSGAFGTSGSLITEYDLTGAQISQFTSLSTYTEGIAAAGGFIYIYNAGASVYGYPDDGYVGDILKYAMDGTFIEAFHYESGDRPPFHSEALSWDGTHFWMAGYSDGKVYRLAAQQAENNFGLIPEPATLGLFAFGLAGLGAMRRRRANA